jgi:DUF2934 family protein
MGGQPQKHSEKKTVIRYQRQPFDKPSMHSQPPLQAEEEKQYSKDMHAFVDTQSRAVSDADRTLVAELAYGLYEQRGRKDGHDLEDWFEAERYIMTQGRSSKLT